MSGKMNRLSYEKLIDEDREWPGCAECREFGFWSRWTDDGWKECESNHPDAGEDFNRLNNWNGSLMWSKEKRRWVKR